MAFLTEVVNILDQVLDYKQKELSVIVLAPKSKKPLSLNWKKYQHAKASEDQIKQ
jgi:hypothetical protein